MKKHLNVPYLTLICSLVGDGLIIAGLCWPIRVPVCVSSYCTPRIGNWTIQTTTSISELISQLIGSGGNGINIGALITSIIAVPMFVIPWITHVLILLQFLKKSQFPPKYLRRLLSTSIIFMILPVLSALFLLSLAQAMIPSTLIANFYIIGGIFLSFISTCFLLSFLNKNIPGVYNEY